MVFRFDNQREINNNRYLNMYKNSFFLFLFIVLFHIAGINFLHIEKSVFASQQPDIQKYVTSTLRVHFIPLQEAANVLEQLKSEQGKVITNQETKTIILVDTAEKVSAMEEVLKSMDVQIMTKTLTLRYVRPQELLVEVEKQLTPNLGAVKVDAEKKQMTITDTVYVVERVRQFIEDFDINRRKMVLQVKLVQIALDDQNLSGVDWQGSLEKYQRIRLKGSFYFLDGQEEDRMLSVGSLMPSDFSMLLEALDTVGLVKEYPLSDIEVNAQEQILLSLKVEDSSLVLIPEPMSTTTAYSPSKSELLFAFKPQLTRDEEVKTSIVLNPSSVVLQTRLSMTTGIGDMIVIGGIIAEEKAIRVKKIPLVGDIPLLGLPFRYRDNTIKREEFVLFITPQLATITSTMMTQPQSSVDGDIK